MELKSAVKFLTIMVLAAGAAQARSKSDGPVVSLSTYSVTSTTVAVSTYPWRVEKLSTAFMPGEKLRYVIKWGVVVAGYSDLTVAGMADVDRRPAYHIVSTARSGGITKTFYKVEDRNELWLDQDALVTVRYEKHIREGKFEIEETCTLDQTHRRWKTKSFRVDKNRYEEKEGELPANVLDAFGSLYYVRTLPLEVGKTYTMDVHNSDKVYPLVMNVLKREKIKVPAGKFECLLVEPQLRGPGIFISKGKKLQVWLSADERHVPVRMRSEIFIGHVSAELLPEETALPANP